MLLEFIKLYSDMEQLFEPYSMEERGKLFTAMMQYAFDGVEPDFNGNERFIWPVLRRHFDQCAAVNEKNAANGSKGGRPRKQAQANETEQNPEKPNETQKNPNEPNKSLQEQKQKQKHIQEQKQEHKQEQEQKQEQNIAREETATAEVIAFDGSNLADDIRRNNIADDMIADFNLARDRVTRAALLEDIEAHGADRMRDVLTTACQSNTRDRVTVNYWRAILNNTGKSGAKKDSGVNYGEVLRQRDYSADYWKSIEVNLEE